MRRIQIKPLKEGRENYADVLQLLLTGPANGQNTTYEEMRITVPVIEKLETIEKTDVGNPVLILEDAEWELVCNRLRSNAAGFIRNEREALTMCEEILNAEQVSAADLEFEKIVEA